MSDLINKPGLSLSGQTWDARHLDKFLSSEWGGKLYNHKKYDEPQPVQSQSPYLRTSIRPSATFMSEARDRKVVSLIDKPLGNSLLAWTGKSPSPQRKNLAEISAKMKELEKVQAKNEEEYTKLLSPGKRRQLFEAEKERLKQYASLKKERLEEVKNDRIVKIGYPGGILGIDSPDRPEASTYYCKVQKDNEKVKRNLVQNRMNRAMFIMNKTSPNYNIQFFNEKEGEGDRAEDRQRGIRRVEQGAVHYHDTYDALFTPLKDSSSPERAERLKQIWRGNRKFDIISGSEYTV